jgi:PilZ domain
LKKTRYDASQGHPDFADLAIVPQNEFRDERLQVEMARMSEDLATTNERRERQRFRINAPVTLFIGDREIPAYTRDLSNRGAYLYVALSDSTEIDSEFEFTVDLPPEVTFATCCQIRCRGQAVRTEDAAMSLTGMAVEILEYSIFRGELSSA